MKAIYQDRYGSADVLSYCDVPVPEPGADEVLLKVRAAGVDPGVWHLMTGLPYLVRLGFGLRRPKSAIPGMDVAGQVVAVGANVTGFKPGDHVFGICRGAFAEFACASEAQLVHKPKQLSFSEAAAIPVSACTALHGLRNTGKLQAGQCVLIVGAGGGVGSFAVQLAKYFGAEVTGLCSAGKMSAVRNIGADHVLDYRRDDFTAQDKKFDLILDTAGNRRLSELRRGLTRDGCLVIVGGEEGGRWLGIGRQLKALILSPFLRQKLRSFISVPRQADLEMLRQLAERGSLHPLMGSSYPLADAAAALAQIESGHVTGKITLTVSQDAAQA